MERGHSTYMRVRLNAEERGWGVVKSDTGALIQRDGRLALKLTKHEADQLVTAMNGQEIYSPGIQKRAGTSAVD